MANLIRMVAAFMWCLRSSSITKLRSSLGTAALWDSYSRWALSAALVPQRFSIEVLIKVAGRKVIEPMRLSCE